MNSATYDKRRSELTAKRDAELFLLKRETVRGAVSPVDAIECAYCIGSNYAQDLAKLSLELGK
jgi:hypothetical protein